jgi:HD superfamily phosphohydrolase
MVGHSRFEHSLGCIGWLVKLFFFFKMAGEAINTMKAYQVS